MRRRAALSGAVVATAAVLASLSAVVTGPASASTPLRTVWREQAACRPAVSGAATCHAIALVPHRVAATAKLATTDVAAPPAAALPSALRGPAGGYTPAALAKAYNFNPRTAASAGQVIAIVDACYDPTIATDLNTFDAQYGLPAETDDTFRVVHTASGADQCEQPDQDGWAVETSLDVQAVRGICQRCRIVLFEAPSAWLPDLARAVDRAAAYRWVIGGRKVAPTAISNSYGAAENAMLPAGYARHYNHPGIAVIAANGDDGWYGWDTINGGDQPESASEVPASLSTVVAVGGTKLTLTKTGARAAETVWNENGNSDSNGINGPQGATGGGCSHLHGAAGWQRSVATYVFTRCGTKKNSTDIAAIADPRTGYDIRVSTSDPQQKPWITVGGTSLAAPVIAALWGLAGGTAGVPNPALTLYGNYKSRPRSLYDVTRGGNALCGSATISSCARDWDGNPNAQAAAVAGKGTVVDCAFARTGTTTYPTTSECRARKGYDGPSGVGTPTGLQVFRALSPTAVVGGPHRVTHRTRVTFTGASSIDPFPGGRIVRWTWSWSNGSPTTVRTPTTQHVFFRKGTFIVRLQVTDSYGRTSASTPYRVVVG
ncbi:MAG: PKD domain-containing protein [Jatrophihabitans sp.]|uniref:PKD domain-containing protein n=1 Tax=Jatrophihabitans sp. TaxID=1932789 RepID=UPI003F7EE32B